MKFLITGLGNIGPEYWGTRHNIGFRVVNLVAEEAGVAFTEERYGAVARLRIKNAELVLLKPNTFMNLSGQAVRYRLQKEQIPIERLLIVVDDIALPFGSLRMKPGGSHGGHNGLRNIEELLETQDYCRLRFGIGDSFSRGRQMDFVLGEFTQEELDKLPERVMQAAEMVKSFCLAGTEITMNLFNRK
ncbi:MAG: aminoacyl-tRNA hydrolase [Tannerella sp.]|jgi:PTH1 family peptidyl-tRNA hydrolase|nr:aminoacyl-tRNA hydrolase [Tannerella sp.]